MAPELVKCMEFNKTSRECRNEHNNGLIRDFYPKKTDFRDVSDADIAKVEQNLNNRPRKALGFLTPAEAMLNYVKLGKWCT